MTEACGPAAAENCAKMKKDKLAEACAERVPGHGWLPPALVTPEEPEAEPEETEDEDGDDQEADDPAAEDTGDEDADNDDEDYLAVAAE